MSQNSIYIENEIIPNYNNNLNYNYSNKEIGWENNYNLQNIPNYNPSKTPKNNGTLNQSKNFDNNYIKDRYTKVKEENSTLKKKLFEIEKDYKMKKGEMEEKVLILRDENSNLQLQIQKLIEKQKDAYKNNDSIYFENKNLLNNLTILKNDTNSLKDTITQKNAEIEEKNKIISDLLNEKNILMNDEKMLNNKIQILMNDKEILIKQIQDLNNTIGDKIAPKLRQNENHLVNLQEQIENLRISNEKLKSDNTLLFNENKIQKNLIKILTKQNKKLLGEIRIIYDRDILLMDNMEKMGSNTSEQFKKLFNQNTLKNQNLFDEDMGILKQSQEYIGDEVENNKDINKSNSSEINGEVVNTDDIINNINKDLTNVNSIISNTNNYIQLTDNNSEMNNEIIVNKNNENNNKKQMTHNSSYINNEIIVKRNKKSIEFDKEIKNNISNNINQKQLYKSTSTDDINNGNSSKKILNEKNNQININNSINDKELDNINNNIEPTIKPTGRYIKYKELLENRNNKLKNEDIDNDINLNNKLIYSQDNSEIDHKKYLNNYFNYDYSNELNSNEFLYKTDGNIKAKNNNNYIKEYENKGNSRNEIDLFHSNSVNSEENNNNNDYLLYSQAKSLLSEYVEDLDVIQDKDSNK